MRGRGVQYSVFSIQIRIFAMLAVLTPFAAGAHIGSPNVFFEGRAGEYGVRVAIRPPAVLPGSAQVDVRVDGGVATNVTLEARLFDVAGDKQPTVHAARIAGETNFFNGVLWLLRNGSYGIELRVEGDKGRGTVSVPLNSAAIVAPAMSPILKGSLVALGVTVFMAAVCIARAIGRDYRRIGEEPSVADQRRGLVVAAAVALALAGGSVGGMTRWKRMDGEFRNNALYKPLPVAATVQTNGSTAMLRLDKMAESGLIAPGWESLAADHGKLMHLFLLKGPDYTAFAHLHPSRRDGQTFENVLPPLPGGRYELYAEITYENGVNQTLVTNLELAGISGAVPQMKFGSNDVICQSSPVPVGDSKQPIALDADDSWHIGNSGDSGAGKKFCRLMGGANIVFDEADELVENKETSLRFTLFAPNGAAMKLQPYMGMLGHAVVRRNDGAVFTHLHPMGTISMAAQNILSQRDGGAGGPTNVLQGGRAESQANSVSFPYAFPRAGQYRIWVQTRVSGQVLTGVFDVEVKKS
jgi:hypothetical protein